MTIFIVWIAFAFFVGVFGSGREIGFGLSFFLAVLLSPVVGFIIVLFSKELPVSIPVDMPTPTNPEPPKKKLLDSSIADELSKFKTLLDQGAITQEEYDGQKKKLLGI